VYCRTNPCVCVCMCERMRRQLGALCAAVKGNVCALFHLLRPSSRTVHFPSPFSFLSTFFLVSRNEKARLQLCHRNRVLSRKRDGGRLFCAWCATKFEFTQLINARQVYRARREMRFSRLPPSCLSSHPFNTACVSRRSRDSLKVGRLLFKPLSTGF